MQVMDTVAAVLGASPGSDEPLMDAGLDSLGAVELRNGLAKSVGMELPGTLVFDYPSVTALAGYLSQQMADAGGVVSDDASTMVSASSCRSEPTNPPHVLHSSHIGQQPSRRQRRLVRPQPRLRVPQPSVEVVDRARNPPKLIRHLADRRVQRRICPRLLLSVHAARKHAAQSCTQGHPVPSVSCTANSCRIRSCVRVPTLWVAAFRLRAS